MTKKNKQSSNASPQTVSEQFRDDVIDGRLTANPLSPFFMDKDELRLALVTAQYALKATRQPASQTSNTPTGLLVLVNGIEQAGKGSAVKQLRQWVDPRLLKVEATIGYPPLAYQPIWQAHIKAMPRHGDVMVYFGNWYADLLYHIMRMVSGEDDATPTNPQQSSKPAKSSKNKKSKLPIAQWQAYLAQQLIALQAFESDLAANQTKLLKCWFHVNVETLKERLHDKGLDPQFLYQIDWSDEEVLATFNEVAATLLRQQGDWVIIDGSDKSQAATVFCHHVLHAMQDALASSRPIKQQTPEIAVTLKNNFQGEKEKNQLDNVPEAVFTPVALPEQLTDMTDSQIDKTDYHRQLAKKQAYLTELLRHRESRHVVFAFEGMDAAGKGGAIKRLVAPLDPREYQIYNIGAPMLYELQHPYLWRFWTRLPNEQIERISRIAIFDRTWYGRVLVERIENFATEDEWQRAYDEINRFEAQLATAGTIVIKYWLAIDKQEQLARFESRQETPHKQFKLTDEDWRNREQWSDYVQAAADMLARTDTEVAPWCVVATNDKRCARLQVLDHAIAQLEDKL